MEPRVVWIHGIGEHHPGFSAEWERVFNPYFGFAHDNYVEVLWDTVFNAAPAAEPGARALAERPADALMTPQERLAEEEVRDDLATVLLARSAALAAADEAGARDLGGGVVAWSELAGEPGERGLLPDWLVRPDAYLGDFAKYLVSRGVRAAVKERAKEQLRPLAGDGYRIAIIAHSWGTVVAYDSLLDLTAELPELRVADLITLGSPLWLVRRLLEERSGRKPGALANWVNVHARGDLVGSWLSRGFRVDHEYEVPNFGGGDAHGSYFAPGNEAVQREIVARAVLE